MAPAPIARCRLCDRPLDPHPLGPVNRLILFHHRGFTWPEYADRGNPPDLGEYVPLIDFCLACIFASEIAGAGHALRAVDDIGEQAATWYIQCLPGHIRGDEWRDFSALVFGRRMGEEPASASTTAPEAYPWTAHRLSDGESATVIQAWLRLVRYRDTSLYLEERWNPLLGDRPPSLHGVSDEVSDRLACDVLRRGRRLLDDLRRPSGRPRASGEYETREALIADVARAIAGLRRMGKKITQEGVGEFLRPYGEDSARQLRDWGTQHDFRDWPDLRDAALAHLSSGT